MLFFLLFFLPQNCFKWHNKSDKIPCWEDEGDLHILQFGQTSNIISKWALLQCVQYTNEQIFCTNPSSWTDCTESSVSLTKSAGFCSTHWWLKVLLSAQLWYTVCYFLVKSLLKDSRSRNNKCNVITLLQTGGAELLKRDLTLKCFDLVNVLTWLISGFWFQSTVFIAAPAQREKRRNSVLVKN